MKSSSDRLPAGLPADTVSASQAYDNAVAQCQVQMGELKALRAENARIMQENEELKRQIQQLRSEGVAESVLAVGRQHTPGR